jgi:hypothetical protein
LRHFGALDDSGNVIVESKGIANGACVKRLVDGEIHIPPKNEKKEKMAQNRRQLRVWACKSTNIYKQQYIMEVVHKCEHSFFAYYYDS